MGFDQNLLLSFLIGASPFIFVLFYLGARAIPQSKIDFTTYAIIVSLYFGIMNMISTYVGARLGLNLNQRLAYTSIVSIFIIWITLYVLKPYDFDTQSEWISHGLLVAIAHIVAFMVIIRYLELYLKST
jgi:hypothetical protein